MKCSASITALWLAIALVPARAQQAEAPPAPQQMTPRGQAMPGGGMMGSGGMGMMGEDMPMMNMMPMNGRMRWSGCGIGGQGATDHIEGRIAFLRAELKITDAQGAAWNALADAMRENAKNVAEVRASRSPSQHPSLADRLAFQEKWLSVRLDGTRAIKAALVTLIGTFSDEQKKMADELFTQHLGMGAMCLMPSARASQGAGSSQ